MDLEKYFNVLLKKCLHSSTFNFLFVFPQASSTLEETGKKQRRRRRKSEEDATETKRLPVLLPGRQAVEPPHYYYYCCCSFFTAVSLVRLQVSLTQRSPSAGGSESKRGRVRRQHPR